MTWYEIYDSKNGEPIAYFKNPLHQKKFIEKYLPNASKEKFEGNSFLENLVKLEEKIIASFEFEPHAIQYNQEFLNGKGTIEPNPKE